MGALYFDGTFLYGMTSEGGANALGTIFKIKPDGTNYTKLLDFDGASKGSNPQGELIYDGTFLYGITRTGGTDDVGVIFKIKPDGSSYTKILDFDLAVYGGSSWGSLYSDGTSLYGTTEYGGANSIGLIFKVSKDGSNFVKLVECAVSATGNSPRGSLISDGTYLYGLTTYGGANDEGAIFKVMPNGSGFTKLHDFALTSSGKAPHGALTLIGSTLYGLTVEGGANDMGTLFKIETNGSSFTKLLDFSGASNGSQPFGSLFAIGSSLYGMTYDGGSFAAGNIFKYSGIPVAISEWIENEDLNVYPNPSNGLISVSTSQTHFISGKTTLVVYDNQGKMVLQKDVPNPNELKIDLSSQVNGVYFLRLTDGTHIVSKKIILNK